jgi:ankyrin repeat protein
MQCRVQKSCDVGLLSFFRLMGKMALGNRVEAAKWLLEQDLGLLDKCDVEGYTVLHLAAIFGAKDSIKFLHTLGVEGCGFFVLLP